MSNGEDTIEYEDEKNTVSDDDGEGGDEAAAKVKKLKDALKKCEELQKEYLDGWQRARADFMNYKKDESKRLGEWGSVMVRDIIEDLLPALDSFRLALQYPMPANIEKGLTMILSQLEDILRKRGVEAIPIKHGEEFNPEKHESVGEIESVEEEGTIAEEVQKGYLMNGKILRAARVKLSKGN